MASIGLQKSSNVKESMKQRKPSQSKFIKSLFPHPNDDAAWAAINDPERMFEPMYQAKDEMGQHVGTALMDSFVACHPEMVVGDDLDIPQDLLMGIFYGCRSSLKIDENAISEM